MLYLSNPRGFSPHNRRLFLNALGDLNRMTAAEFGDPETTAVRVMEGKESLSIDLQHPAGREVMHKLVTEADVFVTSFRPGVPARLGLDYETLSALNPKLVYVHAAGYGIDGP